MALRKTIGWRKNDKYLPVPSVRLFCNLHVVVFDLSQVRHITIRTIPVTEIPEVDPGLVLYIADVNLVDGGR